MQAAWESERGSVLFELTIATPFLVFLTFAAYDFGMYLQNYMRVNLVLREGLRMSASTPGVEVNNPATALFESTPSTPIASLPPRHGQIHLRVRELLALGNPSVNGINLSSSVIRTRCMADVAQSNHRVVRLQIRGQYQSFFLALIEGAGGAVFGLGSAGMPFEITGEAPYLYQSCG